MNKSPILDAKLAAAVEAFVSYLGKDERAIKNFITACELAQEADDILEQTCVTGTCAPLSFDKAGVKFLIKNSETGEPLVNREFIAHVAGQEIKGTTDNNGYAYVDADENQAVQIHILFKAPKQLIKG